MKGCSLPLPGLPALLVSDDTSSPGSVLGKTYSEPLVKSFAPLVLVDLGKSCSSMKRHYSRLGKFTQIKCTNQRKSIKCYVYAELCLLDRGVLWTIGSADCLFPAFPLIKYPHQHLRPSRSGRLTGISNSNNTGPLWDSTRGCDLLHRMDLRNNKRCWYLSHTCDLQG